MLYHDYRPKLFKDVVGNDAVKKSLISVLKRERPKIPHVFLLCGPSGSGKTTLARIIAGKLSCSPRDFHELNTADFRGIDTAREILRMIKLRPISGDVSVWLMDEFHQATKDMQDAMLKALEDTPKHVYFVLATTDPDKVKDTIKTRCPPYMMRALDNDELELLIQRVLEGEKKTLAKGVVEQIIRDSIGSARAALTILDKVIDLDPSEQKAAAEHQASVQNKGIDLCRALISKRPWKEVSAILAGLKDEEPESVRRMVLGYFSAVLANSGKSEAYFVMEAFKDPYYNIGKPGLVMSCYAASLAGK